jgi:hypothetical protein
MRGKLIEKDQIARRLRIVAITSANDKLARIFKGIGGREADN